MEALSAFVCLSPPCRGFAAAAGLPRTASPQCNHKHQCFTCEPDGSCAPLKHHQRLLVSQHGALQGRHQMKAEIFARGPITCGIMATAGLDEYTGGADTPSLPHSLTLSPTA